MSIYDSGLSFGWATWSIAYVEATSEFATAEVHCSNYDAISSFALLVMSAPSVALSAISAINPRPLRPSYVFFRSRLSSNVTLCGERALAYLTAESVDVVMSPSVTY